MSGHSSGLYQWVIYEKPKDYPSGFVVRRWLISTEGDCGIYPERLALYAASLLEARALVPAGLYCLARSPEDDACIVEVWT